MRMDAQSVSDGQGDVPDQGPKPTIPSTRTSVSWTFVAIAIVALVIVLVFILENLHATDATFSEHTGGFHSAWTCSSPLCSERQSSS